MHSQLLVPLLMEDIFFDSAELMLILVQVQTVLFALITNRNFIKLRERYFRPSMEDDVWIDSYHEYTFYGLFRLKKETFQKFAALVIDKDEYGLIKKKYRGGNFPVHPEKSLLIFLWYMATQDSLIYISDRFGVSASTVMQIVNAALFTVISLKMNFIFWPKTQEEFAHIRNGFQHYPG